MKFAASPSSLRPRALLAAFGLLAALGLAACSRTTHVSQSLTAPGPEAADAGARIGVDPSKPQRAPVIAPVPSDPTAKPGLGLGKPRRVVPGVPGLVSPADGVADVSTAPALSWAASDGATSYQTQVSENSSFSARVLDRSGISGTTTSATGLKAGTTYFWRVRASNKNLTSAFSSVFKFTTGAGAPPPVSTDPCASMNGLGGSVNVAVAEIPQFRVDRLRIELVGDVAAGTINSMGKCTSATPIRDSFISGVGDARISGSGQSCTATGQALSFGPLLQVPGESGIVLATDAAGNVLEVIWPALAGDPAGPPILRLELAVFSGAVRAGESVDADITLVARAPDGTTTTFTAHGAHMTVPPLKAFIAPPLRQ